MKLRFFLLQPAQLPQRLHRVASLRQRHAVCQHRRQERQRVAALHSQSLPRKGMLQPCDSADSPRPHILHGLILSAAVDPQLIHFLLPNLGTCFRAARVAHRHLHPQYASRNFQMSQPDTGSIPGYLVHPGGEIRPVFLTPGKAPDARKQLLKPLHAQGGTEVAGKNMPFRDRFCYRIFL